jgi:hypothetical protein
VPDRRGPDGALGLGLLAGAGAALLAGGLLGVLWLTPRRVSFREPEHASTARCQSFSTLWS